MNVRRLNRPLAASALRILRAEHPMTLRQLFYRVVSAGVLPSTDAKWYTKLGRMMTGARESGRVPFPWIVDHVRTTLKPSSWSGLADFGETVRDAYRKDLWAEQDHYVEILIEKDAVAGTIQPITEKYDVALRVLRGYASVSFAGEIASLWARIRKPIVTFYLGDFDPSGFDIERDLRQKIGRYAPRVNFTWQRIGVRDEDFDAFDLLPLRVKKSDNRASKFIAAHGNRCAELDALPPTELRRRVESAVAAYIDPGRWERLQRVEQIERETMQNHIAAWAKLKLDSVSIGEAVA